MNLPDTLERLERSQLLQHVIEDEPSYIFKHALLLDAAYDSLLKNDRRALHLAAGKVLETLYADRLDEHSPILARHFSEAGDDERALTYLVLAGERAARHYANREAVEHYTAAIEIAPRVGAPLAKLYRARGLAYEAQGDYERARADQQAALQAAQASQDRRGEWLALLDLGKLWSERDYHKTGDYFQQAYDLARTIDDPAILGASLNRIGNWCVNVERPGEALRHHQEALAIFKKIGDRRGEAETFDLLGTATTLGGDLVQSATYYRQAGALFREFGDPVSLASSLTTLSLGGAEFQTISVVLSAANLQETQAEVEEALKIAREIGWRSAEAFALIAQAMIQGSRGLFAPALESALAALTVSGEIGHKQWMTYAHAAVGEIYAHLFASAEARRHLESGLELARETGSRHWIRTLLGFLASEYVRQNELELARSLLDASVGRDDPPQTIAQRLVYTARVDLALACGNPNLALEIIDELIAQAAHVQGPAGLNILGVSAQRGRAFVALGQWADAQAAFLAARAIADDQGALPFLWEIDAALARVYRAEGRAAEAESAERNARVIVDRLAEQIDDATLKSGFVQGAREAGAWGK